MSAAFCIRCLCYVQHCQCEGGPRLQRHPSACQCAMCEQGRAILAGTDVEADEETVDG